MTEPFFQQLVDALYGFVPEERARFSSRVHRYGAKVWFGDEHREHYEAQLIKGGLLEIGFHTEHPKPARNDEVLALLLEREESWRAVLGSEPVAGPFLGGREDTWRRVSETWDADDVDDPDVAIDAADRLAAYIAAIEPCRERTRS